MIAPYMIRVHEAGHVVAALAMGQPVACVQVSDDDGDTDAGCWDARPWLDEAAFMLAGFAAERLAGCYRHAWGALLNTHALPELAALDHDGDRVATITSAGLCQTRDAIEEATRLVTTHAGAVLDLADRLAGQPYADGPILAAWWAEARQIVRDTRGPETPRRSRACMADAGSCPGTVSGVVTPDVA